MGKVKQTNIKTFGDSVMKEHPEKVSEDFEENKKLLNDIALIKSKRLRNVVAGYISKKKKRQTDLI